MKKTTQKQLKELARTGQAQNITNADETTNPEEVKKGEVITVACNYFDQIAAEINFNSYDYTDDLHKPVEVEEIPF